MIILLNGPSSSGKSSIVTSLLSKLNELYFVFGVDKFLESSMPPKLNMETLEHIVIVDKAISSFNNALGEYSKKIDYMIIDYVMQNPKWIHEVANSLANADVFFVGITAPLDVIESREIKRKDRQPGTARAQFEQMKNYEYDLLIDTSIMTPDLAADLIIKNLRPGQSLKKYAR